MWRKPRLINAHFGAPPSLGSHHHGLEIHHQSTTLRSVSLIAGFQSIKTSYKETKKEK